MSVGSVIEEGRRATASPDIMANRLPEGDPDITPAARNTITLAATLGYLFDAYAINIYGMTLTMIALEYNASLQTMGIIGSLFLAGYMIGSFAFGMLGDIFGRKKTLGFSIFAYGSVTALTGFALNPIHFAIGRFFTGVGGGGELTVGVPYVVESWDRKRKGLGAGLMFSGYALGVVYAAIVSYFVLDWLGWRAMYFLAAVPAIIILFVRTQLEESPAYTAMQERRARTQEKRVSFWEALRGSRQLRRHLGLGTLVYISLACIYYAETVFVVQLMETVHHLTTANAVAVLGLFNIAMFSCAIGGGVLADRIGRKAAGAIVIVALALALWTMFSTASLGLFVFFGAIAFAGIGGSWAIGMVYVAELFPTEIRGAGFGWSVALGRLPSVFVPAGVAWVAGFAPGGISDAMKFSAVLLVFAFIAYLTGPETLRKAPKVKPALA